MSDITKEYVVCVSENDVHTEISILRRCDICFALVWCMPHNLTRIPLCMPCALKLPDAEFFLRKEDFDAAIDELRKRHTKPHDGT